MVNPVAVRNLTLGAGRTKIIAPITGKSLGDILRQAKLAADSKADMAEWRADYFEGGFDIAALTSVLRAIRGVIMDMPLIFTLRTAAEGGFANVSCEDYCGINSQCAGFGLADVIDTEVFMSGLDQDLLIKDIHGKNCLALASFHDFCKTPPKAEIINILEKMQSTGCDIIKLAVMPKCPEDVLELLSASLSFNRNAKKPLIAISMGREGAFSRLAGASFSCAAFGRAGQGSEEGQPSVGLLREFILKA